MIVFDGPKEWANIHVTRKTRLANLVHIKNGSPELPEPRGFDQLVQVARDVDLVIQQARQQGRRIRALGSGWALTDITITDGWLINTNLLTDYHEYGDRYFEPAYPQQKRPYVVVAQAGMSIWQLNLALEGSGQTLRRSLKTAGIGAGQSIAGAISGNTHGSAVNFGAMPEFVIGLQLVTGTGKSLWLERASEPVFNNEFITKLNAELIRDDDVFNAAIVGLGAFGVITAVAVATDPIYQLKFPPVHDITHTDLKQKLNTFNANDPAGLHHYEFVYDPYSKDQVAMETWATRVDYEPGHAPPKPVWIPRTAEGFAFGDRAASLFFKLPLPPQNKTGFQFKQYRQRCILGDVRATPGQLFTATITYLEGYTETALGISINDAAKMIDISSDVIKRMKLPAMSQVRVVKAGRALLGFTNLPPRTCVFEYGLANDGKFKQFEDTLVRELTSAGVPYTFHWSKNSGIDPARLDAMYGADRVSRWKAARRRVFGNDDSLMRVFDNQHLIRTGLA